MIVGGCDLQEVAESVHECKDLSGSDSGPGRDRTMVESYASEIKSPVGTEQA